MKLRLFCTSLFVFTNLFLSGQALPTTLDLNLKNTPKKTEFKQVVNPEFVSKKTLLNHLKFLSLDHLQGRKTGQPGNKIARQYLIDWLLSQGLDVTLQPFSFQRTGTTYNAVNIIATIQGTENPNRYIAVTAHYDHVGVGKTIQNDSIYNGADDNASGTAALMTMASYFSKNKPKNSLMLIALDAEELGLQGAHYFIENKGDKNILLNLNMDMISRNKAHQIYICGTRYTPSLKTYFNAIPTEAFPIEFILGHDGLDGKDDWSTQSDHFHFFRNNIPFLYFGVEDHSGYHQPSDEFEFIHPEFFYQTTLFIINTLKDLDQKIE